jgi:hypothetical protein
MYLLTIEEFEYLVKKLNERGEYLTDEQMDDDDELLNMYMREYLADPDNLLDDEFYMSNHM